MDDERDLCRFSCKTSDNSRLGTVRMNHIVTFFPEQFYQETVRFEILDGRNFANQPGTFHNLESRTRDLFQQFAFRSGRGTGHQSYIVSRFHSPARGEQSVFLRSSYDHPGDDMTDLHDVIC